MQQGTEHPVLVGRLSLRSGVFAVHPTHCRAQGDDPIGPDLAFVGRLIDSQPDLRIAQRVAIVAVRAA